MAKRVGGDVNDATLSSGSQLLVALSSDSVYRMFEPSLKRTDLTVTRVRSGQHAVTLARDVWCDAVVCQHPFTDLGFEEFHAQLRSPEWASRAAPLLVVTRDDRRQELAECLERDERLACVGLDREQINRALGELIGAAVRADERLLVETRVNCHSGKHVFQTANISESGFLLRSHKPLKIGSRARFVLELPDSERPVSGVVEVVRHTNAELENVEGMAVCLVDVDDDGRARLARLVQHKLFEQE
jgi:CheY-like chemotaxis protein